MRTTAVSSGVSPVPAVAETTGSAGLRLELPVGRVPRLSDPMVASDWGYEPGRATSLVLSVAGWLSGFDRFLASFSNFADDLCSRDWRTSVPGPLDAATVALEDDPARTDATSRAAALILGALDLHDDIVNGRLEPDTFNGVPLEMRYYRNLFGAHLVVSGGKKRIVTTENAREIAVLSNGHVFMLSVLDAGLKPIHEHSLRASLDDLQRQANTLVAHPLGPISAAFRETQAPAFDELENGPFRGDLERLRRALFIVCLEPKHCPNSHKEALRLAHSENCANRWFGGSLQFVVFGNGRACAIAAFNAHLDGNVMMRAVSELQARALRCTVAKSSFVQESAGQPVSMLHLPVSRELRERAEADLKRMRTQQEVSFELDGYGQDFFRSFGVRPVAAFVTVLHRAFYRATGNLWQIEQFVSMAHFRHMGIRRVVVSSEDADAFATEVIDDGAKARTFARTKFDAAVAFHDAQVARARRDLSVRDLWQMFLATSSESTRRRARLIHQCSDRVLKTVGAKRPRRPVLFLSHPVLRPGVVRMGRPGIRSQQRGLCALHYHVDKHVTLLTMMPAAQMKTADVIRELRRSLDELHKLYRA